MMKKHWNMIWKYYERMSSKNGGWNEDEKLIVWDALNVWFANVDAVCISHN